MTKLKNRWPFTMLGRNFRKIFGFNKTATDHEQADFERLYSDLAASINESFHSVYDQDKASRREGGKQEAPSDESVSSIVELTRLNFENTLSTLLAAQMSRGVLRQIEQQYRAESGYERTFDKSLTRLRWFAAIIFLAAVPIIFGITCILLGESYLIIDKSIDFMLSAWSKGDLHGKQQLADLYGTILSMLDMMLISALVMMVTIGGYENTVSRIGLNHAFPRWFGKLDIGSLKIKVAQSIATISAIHLLLNFMMIDTNSNFDPSVIMWTAIVHVVFVVSAFILAYVNKIAHIEHDPVTKLHEGREKTHDGSKKRKDMLDMVD